MSYRVVVLPEEGVNLRMGPGLDRPVIATKIKGDILEIQSEYMGWKLLVGKTPEGYDRWVWGELVAMYTEPKVTLIDFSDEAKEFLRELFDR